MKLISLPNATRFRANSNVDDHYSMLNPAVWLGVQERQRALIRLLSRHTVQPLSEMRVLEIGCGGGGNLLELLRMGFSPEHLVGNELLPDRVALARRNLPAACQVLEGDATQLGFEEASFDIVYQSTVFTSLLDDQFKQALADRMWSWVKPGGAVMWYDFIYNNPKNKDVRGIPLDEIKKLFPRGQIFTKRVTLAPPISRRVTELHPLMYAIFNSMPFLRTHVVCWIQRIDNGR